MPPAARVIVDQHVCPAVSGLVPHVGGPLMPPGVPTVTIGGMPAAVVGTLAFCAGGPATVIKGSATVTIGSQPAARVGDQTAHGGTIVPPGCLTVIIGG